MADKVTLGDHEVDVYPQRHAYLTNKLSKYVTKLAASDLDIGDAGGVASFLGGEAYDLLSVLIPAYGKRCPRFEFLGYDSQEAFEHDEYDEDKDKSPTFDQIIEAFAVSARVQRFDSLKALGKVIDPKLIRGWINKELAIRLTSSVRLPSAQDGVGPLTSSGATSPTSTASAASPSPDSKPSPEPATNVS
jgi:hypothetical protein